MTCGTPTTVGARRWAASAVKGSLGALLMASLSLGAGGALAQGPAPSRQRPASKAAAKPAEPTARKAAQAVAVEKEGPEGVKTYQFGALEVEANLKSPQLIYFLRRVRAEFEAGALGHRSFLGELSDTRNETPFR